MNLDFLAQFIDKHVSLRFAVISFLPRTMRLLHGGTTFTIRGFLVISALMLRCYVARATCGLHVACAA